MTTAPEFTGNNLSDIVKFLRNGDIVILNNDRFQITYHKCSDFPESKRTIHVDTGETWASLLNDDEWPYEINAVNIKPCTCNIKTDANYYYRL
jgi:hypothetical protein